MSFDLVSEKGSGRRKSLIADRKEAVTKYQVFFAIEEVRRGRDDLPGERRPGRPFSFCLAGCLERRSHTTVGGLAPSLDILPHTAITQLHE
jgi:hypothetical protein